MEKRLPKIVRFASRVLRDFFLRNHGLLLTAAVAHNVMLSLIPLSAVIIVVFSHFIDEALLMQTITTEISLIAPGFAPTLTEVLVGFLATREIIGWLGVGSLLLFSSLAFRVLEDAFAIIFHRPIPTLKRKFWVSALMPYLFIGIVAAGLIAITTVNAIIDAQDQKTYAFTGLDVLLHNHVGHLIYLTGLLGLVLLRRGENRRRRRAGLAGGGRGQGGRCNGDQRQADCGIHSNSPRYLSSGSVPANRKRVYIAAASAFLRRRCTELPRPMASRYFAR